MFLLLLLTNAFILLLFINYRIDVMASEISTSTDEDIRNMPDRISATFSDRTIFMTGGSGFLGKVLLEKILRKCQVKTIYLLFRAKKGKGPQHRIEEMFTSPVCILKKIYYIFIKNK